MANLTTRLGFAFEHQDFSVSQNQGLEEELWNRLGLEGFAPVIVPTVPQYGEPFLDFTVSLRQTLGFVNPVIGLLGLRCELVDQADPYDPISRESPIVSFLGFRCRLITTIERESKMPSSRIDRSSK